MPRRRLAGLELDALGVDLRQQPQLSWLCRLERAAGDDLVPMFGVCREHAVIAQHVKARWWDQSHQPRDQFERCENHGMSAVPPGSLEANDQSATIGRKLETLLRERWPRYVSAQSLEPSTIAAINRRAGVHIHPANVGERFVGLLRSPRGEADLARFNQLQFDGSNTPEFEFGVALTNDGDEDAMILVTRGDDMVYDTVVPAQAIEVITLPWVDSLTKGEGPSALVTEGAYRLRSDRPVAVYQHSPFTPEASSNDAKISSWPALVSPSSAARCHGAEQRGHGDGPRISLAGFLYVTGLRVWAPWSLSPTRASKPIAALVSGPILMGEYGAAVGVLAIGQVDVGILGRVRGIAVADLEVARRSIAAVDELVAVAGPGREPGARARGQGLLAGVSAQHQLALEHVDELVLEGVMVAHRRLLARRQGGQVDADLGQPKRVAERPLLTRQHA